MAIGAHILSCDFAGGGYGQEVLRDPWMRASGGLRLERRRPGWRHNRSDPNPVALPLPLTVAIAVAHAVADTNTGVIHEVR